MSDRAGAIAVRRSRGRTQVLLVRAKGTSERVFPKGHIEPGETPEAAACRELEEEAGIQGRVLGSAGRDEYESDGEQIRVSYFLVKQTGVSKGEEGRAPIWVDPRVALTLLTFENTRNLLQQLLPTIDRMGPRVTPAPKGFDDLLLADFTHLGESLINNEEQGEKRVTFFVTLVTATAGALGYFGDKMTPAYNQRWSLMAAAALAVLLVFGLQTLQRVVERNITSDGFKIRLNHMRRYFASTADRTQRGFLAFDPDRVKPRSAGSWPWKGRGGWVDTVVLVNAVITGAVIGLLTWSLPVEWRVVVSFGVFLLAWPGIHRLGVTLHRERWEKEATRL